MKKLIRIIFVSQIYASAMGLLVVVLLVVGVERGIGQNCQTFAASTNEESQIVGINLSSQTFSVTFSPNPADEFLEISVQSMVAKGSIRLMDNMGHILIEEKIESKDLKTKLNTKKLYPGAFILEVVSGENKFSDKVVVAH